MHSVPWSKNKVHSVPWTKNKVHSVPWSKLKPASEVCRQPREDSRAGACNSC